MSNFIRCGLLAASVVLAGCSETGFQDFFDSGKFSPDETKVRSNQALTTPPDLQLRPPSGAAAPPPNQVVTGQQPVTTQPPQYGAAPPASQQAYAQPQQPGTQPQQPAYPQTTTPQAGAQPARPPVTDPYARYGISKTRPDGTLKSQNELLAELRAKKLELERKKNPNYGTIFNLPNVWKDS